MTVISLMLNYVGDIVVIFSVNSTGEEYWDVEDAVPYTYVVWTLEFV